MEVDGVGPEVAKSIRRFFSLPDNRRFLDAALHSGLQVQQARNPGGGALEGRLFCFTGSLESIGRDEAKQLVEARGGRTTGSISKKVTDVVAGATAGAKLAKARKLDLRILEEAEFLELVDRVQP